MVAVAPPALADDIVVLARKREESLLKVPVIATALQAEQLDQYSISDMNSITERVPGLNVGGNVGSIGTQVTLRGVGTTSLNANLDQSVSLNVDGLQLTNGNAFRSSHFDMAQIEVLKGPQALFYGKASPAGVISVRTNDPTDDFEVVMRAGYEFVARGKVGELILSGPVSDTLRVRLATQYSQTDGYWKNGFVAGNDTVFGTGDFGAQAPEHSRFPHEKNFFIRGTVLWEPSDRFNARLKVNYLK
jgi:iron complex outermembrane receptor protein